MADTDLILSNEEIPSSSGLNNDSGESAGQNEEEKITIRHPNHLVQKLVALTLMCLLGFGSYFCYDNPAALQDHFVSDMSLTTSQFVLLYSWYAWPNVILCAIGGYLMDRVFGIRLGTCIYALLVVIGQLIFAAGVYTNRFWLAILGRFIFGAGGESLAVAQNSYAVVWFKGKELNMVFGFQLSFARTGSTVNFFLMEYLYRFINKYYTGFQCLGVALFIASISTLGSFLSGLLLAWQDKHAERVLKRKQPQPDELAKISDVKNFPLAYWLTTFTIVCYYGAILPFVALGKVFFERKYDLPADQANFVNSILFFVSSVLSPFLGLIVDKFGKNVSFVFVSLLITIASHMMLGFTFINPYISMCIMGVSYSMVASALWPLIALVTPEHLLGTAYGIAQSFENLGLGVITVMAGVIADNYGYFILEAYFIGCLCLALIFIIIIWVYDLTHSGYLNMSTKERVIYEKNTCVPKSHEKEKLLDSDYGSVSEDEQTHLIKDSSTASESITTTTDVKN
ncbi:major facilitator superfamily domain-containing protein 1-like [Planococcus citri]|uniref:major facilitator superfamily domain-containing protein 1-like n=1 Tax=Planococcus citri TaxID=170843 RepID=UPI0031F7C33C